MGWLKRKPFVEPQVSSRFPVTRWAPVIRPFYGGYAIGLVPNENNEFGREEWDETSFFRLSDMHPAFNLAGLYWRVA